MENVDRLRSVLHDHWIAQIACDHARHTDSVVCSCSKVHLPERESVYAAIDTWIDHVLEMLDAPDDSVPWALRYACACGREIVLYPGDVRKCGCGTFHRYWAKDEPDRRPIHRPDFRAALTDLLNTYNRENGSNTPDFVLATFLLGCLGSFDAAVRRREVWYARQEMPEIPLYEG